MTEISFPALSTHVLQVGKTLPFTIFGVQISWYAAIIFFGILVSAGYAFRNCHRFGIARSAVLEYLVVGIPCCYIGARLYYVIYEWDYYAQNIGQIFNLKSGGLAIYGAVLAGALSVVLYFHLKQGNVLRALDLGSICILMGQVIGRWGNFINGEAHGYMTTLPWGMSINGGETVHPTFLYESLWNFLLLLLMHLRSKKPLFPGEVMLWYIAGYGLGRAWIEGLRTDSLYWWGTSIRVSQALALISAAGALGVLCYFYVTKRYPQAIIEPRAAAAAGAKGKKKKGKKRN